MGGGLLNEGSAGLELLCFLQWNFAFELKFGLYEWNDDGTQERRLRDGAKVQLTCHCLYSDLLTVFCPTDEASRT